MGNRERGKREHRKYIMIWSTIFVLITAAGVIGIIAVINSIYRKNTRNNNTEASIYYSPSEAESYIPETAAQISEAYSEEQESEPESTIKNTEGQTEETTKLQTYTREADASVAVGSIEDLNPQKLHLVMVGDNLMHRDVSMSGLMDDGSFNYDYNFKYIRDITQAADIAIINQEAVIGGDVWGIRDYPCFNARTEVAAAISAAGFDVVLAANNHVLDIGKAGSLYMIDFFKSHYPGIMLLGIHNSWETRDTINVIERNGIKIGMINYTQILNCMTDYNNGGQYLVDMLDYDRLAELIQRTKAASDFVVVFPHWGTEYNMGIDNAQQQQTAFFAQQGVDLVIGTHPHVVEPVKYVDRPDGGRMLVYYSLGNYQSLQRKEATLIGAMADVYIRKDYNGTYITDFNMPLLATDYRLGGRKYTDYFDIITTYPWSMYSKEFAASGKIGDGNTSFSLDRMFEIAAGLQAQVHEARHEAGLE